MDVVADIGGTHVRVAISRDGKLHQTKVYRVVEHESFEAVLEHYRRSVLSGHPVRRLAAAVAAPVVADPIRFTNSAWSLSRGSLQAQFSLERAHFINDFSAVALALAYLRHHQLRELGAPLAHRAPVAHAAKAVLGPGTGLGVSGLVPDHEGGFAPIAGEGGHVDLAPSTEREWQAFGALERRFGHVSAERVLSGPGLATLYSALCEVDKAAPLSAEPESIVSRAHQSPESRDAEAVAMFTGWLGAVAGDLALTLGARGGVYVAGGIVPAWGNSFDGNRFRERFESKGRYRDYLQSIPTYVITEPYPALLGLARFFSTPPAASKN